MKIAVSSEVGENTGRVELRFGRARWFLVFDTESKKWETYDNSAGADALQGAGPQTVRALNDLGVRAVVTGRVGPKASAALEAAKIAVYQADSTTVLDAVRLLEEGKLRTIDMPGPPLKGSGHETTS